MGCRTSVREDSRVLLERCDRLCVVEVMSGVYHDSEFLSCARSVRPAGVIHSVPAKNKTKKQRINKETRSPHGAGPKISVVLCKDANSWFGEMLIAFCLPSFVIGYVSGRPGVSAVPAKGLQIEEIRQNKNRETRLCNAAVGPDDIKSRSCAVNSLKLFFLWALSNPLAQTTIVCKLQPSEFGQYLRRCCLLLGSSFCNKTNVR